jgi:hypothetical protein
MTAFDRFDQLKACAARALNMPVDSGRVATLASLQLAHERQIEQLAAGQRVDLTAFARIIELLDKFQPPPPPMPLTIQIIGRGEKIDRLPRDGSPLRTDVPPSDIPPTGIPSAEDRAAGVPPNGMVPTGTPTRHPHNVD